MWGGGVVLGDVLAGRGLVHSPLNQETPAPSCCLFAILKMGFVSHYSHVEANTADPTLNPAPPKPFKTKQHFTLRQYVS